MILKTKKDKLEFLYQFLTTTADGVTSPLELKDSDELDKQVEKMLSEDGYSKSDFIIVKLVDYTIDATSYTDAE